MILMIEIGLTVVAWRRGWKAWALLPLGIGIGIGFLGGLILGISGLSEDVIFAVGVVGDLICIGALIGMIAKPRKVINISDTTGQPLQHSEPVNQNTTVDVVK